MAVEIEEHVYQFTLKETTCYTDRVAWPAYNHIIREHATVFHDDDGDVVREVHTNTAEGMWTDVRNYLRPFICK